MDDGMGNRRTVQCDNNGGECGYPGNPETDVLNDFEVCRYVRLENGLNADVYSLEIIIPIAFRLNTYYTHVFRSWLLRKAYAKEQKDTYMLFVPIAKGGHC